MISEEELAKAKQIIGKILGYYSSKVVGQEELGASILVAMIANGHILLESVPGLAKTTAAKVMTEAVSGSFSRIQCTPDLIPSDIIGTQTYNASIASLPRTSGFSTSSLQKRHFPILHSWKDATSLIWKRKHI